MNIGSISSFRANINQRFGYSQPEKKELKSRYTKEEWLKLTEEEKNAWFKKIRAEGTVDESGNGR